MREPLLLVSDLKKHFSVVGLVPQGGSVYAVDRVPYSISLGDTLSRLIGM